MKKKMLLLMVSVSILNLYNCSAADGKQTDAIGMTSLHVAAMEDNVPNILTSLNEGADINSGNLVHMTPLHLASQHGNIEAIRMLLLSITAMTPVDYAKINHHPEAVTLLMQYGGKQTMVQSILSNSSAATPRYGFSNGDVMANRKRKREESYESSFELSSERKKIGSFSISEHALTRLLARGASEKDILHTLNYPEKSYIQEDGTKIFIGPEWKVVTNPREMTIITIMSSQRKI
jgi:hypothetical protein